jgi:hypothetical protein
MVPLITFACALIAFILAILHGSTRTGRPPLWVAVAILALGVMLPWIAGMLVS